MRRYCLLVAVLLLCSAVRCAFADDLSAIAQSCGKPLQTAGNYNTSTKSFRRSIAYKTSEGEMVFVNFKGPSVVGPWTYLSASGDANNLPCLAASGVHVRGSSAARSPGRNPTAGSARNTASAEDLHFLYSFGIGDLLVIVLGIALTIHLWKRKTARERYEFEHRTSGGVVGFASFEEARAHEATKTLTGCLLFIIIMITAVALVAGFFCFVIWVGSQGFSH